MIDKKKQGKNNRRKGKEFENLVRKDLESKGWIVSKWQNNVEFNEILPEEKIGKVSKADFSKGILSIEGELDKEIILKEDRLFRGKLIPCKAKFNPFTKRVMMQSGGFPDFIAYQINNYSLKLCETKFPVIIGVESKMNGKLDKLEKEKCKWLLDNHIFSKILIAKKGKEGIKYNEFGKEGIEYGE